ncbi:hypothetical protein [Roseovarius indicus]|uniref:hypothetical protein n=1 Tax=Roseovarius indicus TaxID=540747 RepID=UPI0032EC633B
MTRLFPALTAPSRLSALPLLATLLAQPAAAQVLEASSDATIRNRLCIGGECTDNPTPDFVADGFTASLEIRDFRTRIDFVDRSDANFPNTNWAIELNEPNTSIPSGGTEYFAIQDNSAFTVPFLVRGGAPTNAFFLAESGAIGLQTSLPQMNLHIVDTGRFTEAGIRLEDTTGTPYSWDLRGNNAGFYLFDVTANRLPFQVRPGAPSSSLEIASTGFVGIGTESPGAPLEVSNNDTFSYFRITAEQAAINQSADMTFTGGPLGTGEFRYNIVDGDGPEMRLNADGDMVLDGTLTTGGPTCAGGCDAVFDADFDRLSVTDHATLMWENGHLPAVGVTLPGAPMNVSEKMGGILNELEHAHIYIEELHSRMARQEEQREAQDAVNIALSEQLAALAARLEKLEVR